jgi:hypothetical protein
MPGLGWSNRSGAGLVGWRDGEADFADLFRGVAAASAVERIGELGVFAGDWAGGLVFGDSRTTFVGVALTLNER